jgi:hypothetical protein
MKLIASSFIALASIVASAQPQTEPKVVMLVIQPDSAKEVCPKEGQTIKVRLTTDKKSYAFTMKPPGKDNGFKTQVDIDNKNGHLHLGAGVKLEITTPDGKTWTQQNLKPSVGAQDYWEITCFHVEDGWELDFYPK